MVENVCLKYFRKKYIQVKQLLLEMVSLYIEEEIMEKL